MKKILGLDIGTNSIGWALIEEENNILRKINSIGSRIIPLDKGLLDEYEKGNDISKNATRRQKRGSRRLNHRYRLRRNNLITLFRILGIVPAGLEPIFNKIKIEGKKLLLPQSAFEKGVKQLNPYELYELRSIALNKKISLEELFRIIYHLNQRRGFKSNRKANKTEDENQTENIFADSKKQSEISYEKVTIVNVEPTGERKGKKQNEELRVILEDGRSSLTDKFIFKKLIGETVILKIKKEILKSTKEPKYTFSIPSKWQKNRKELNEAIIKAGGFPGKYFFEEYLKAKNESKWYEFKVRESIVNRELYENEFQTIWDTQHKFWLQENNIDINFLKNYKEAIETIVPFHNKKEKQKWIQKGIGSFIRNYIIYYQRELRSQTRTIGDCRFEEKYFKKINEETGEVTLERSGPKCCPKSHPAFQEFRIWQQINNLIVYDEKEEVVNIDDNIKVNLFNYLNEREEVKPEEIKKFLQKKFPQINEINVVKNWMGNRMLHFFKKIFNSKDFNGKAILEYKEKFMHLWHLIYSVTSEKGIKTGLTKLDPNIPQDLIKILSSIDYKEKQYASLSLKAIKNLLPLMKCGSLFNENELTEKAKSRIDQFLSGELDREFDEKTLEKLKVKKTTEDFKGLSYYKAASLIYGKHTAKQENRYEQPEDILPVPRNSLRNPIVEQVVNETLMLVKDIWVKHPELKEGEIRIELARELKSNKEERQRVANRQEINKNENLQAVEEIRRHFGSNYNPSLADIEKVKLWKEAGMKSPYTGQTINISDLFSSNVEVDHIIPRTRYYNDGLINKTICESHINSDKDKMTAYEYMNTGTPYQFEKLSYDKFLEFIKRFPVPKRRMFTMKEIPDDFIERQIKDTQYIAVRIKEELGKIVGLNNVKTTTGQITDYLREQWGLGELMKKLLKPRFEKLQEKFSEQLVNEEEIIGSNGKPTGKKRTVIKGYSKRFDHRHHAIDALIVACTRQGIVQQLNLLNKITKGKTKQIEETIGDSLRKFIPPTGKDDIKANKFFAIAEEAVSSIIVSYKNRKRLVSKGINWYQKFNSNKNKIEKFRQEKGIPWAIKGRLHEETNYGVIEHDGQLKFTCRYLLSELTTPQIHNILSLPIKEAVLMHLNKPEYNGDLKKAFGPEGLIDFNKNRKIPVYSVVVIKRGNVDEVRGTQYLYEKERKLVVDTGGNYYFSVYEHPETKERKFDVVSFFDAVQLKINGENPYKTEIGYKYESEGYKLIFSITHNDLVYASAENESVEEIDWTNIKLLSDNIYRVVKFSGTQIYFQPYNYSQEITIHEGKASSAKEYKGEFNKGTNGTEKILGTDISIKNVCIKLNVDRLGNIKPAVN